MSEWNKSGQPFPPPHLVKQDRIVYYKNKHNCKFLVETGTYLGDMVWAQRKNFERIYSIELDRDLAHAAHLRFNPNAPIEIIQGDSGKVLKNLMSKISEKTIFWLDGHYSGGITAKGDKFCPIFEELDAIFLSDVNHVLIIDDARLFVGEDDYPTTDELSSYILEKYPKSCIQIENDAIIVELAR